MIYKERFIELWVNGNKVELEDQESVKIRFNNVLFDPTKISSTQAEYSFEFEVPCTPKNNIIFDYANNLSKTNKFHQRYNAEVYADGTPIFSGTITINSVKDNMYNLNLVSVKVYSLDDIFGDMTMNKIKDWKIDFDGVETINAYNNMDNPDVVFPFVSYGAFQKNPYSSDEVGKDFTSKFDIDEWNMWYVESFYPSHKMLTTLKKAFESKDYTVGGDAFENQFLDKVYMSVNLADEQDPTYNLGNKKFGEVSLNINWQTPTNGTPYTQYLKFPYWRAGGVYQPDKGTFEEEAWNFSSIEIYDMLSSNDGGSYTMSTKSYMFNPDETMIMIPADGWYKIDINVSASLSSSQGSLTATQFCRSHVGDAWYEDDVEIPAKLKTCMPLEIQLVRNYEDNIELISGKNKYFPKYGYPAEDTKFDDNNRVNVTTCFPHEKLGTNWANQLFSVMEPIAEPPTETNDLGVISFDDFMRHSYSRQSIITPDCKLGYIYKDGTPMMYDQVVSKAFICGFTSLGNDNGGGCGAIMRKGRSWCYKNTESQDTFYYQPGYDKADTTSGWDDITLTSSDYNSNSYISAPTNSYSQSANGFQGRLYCMVELKKNDKLKLYAVQREYKNSAGTRQRYKTNATVSLKITAASPKQGYALRNENYGYISPSQFDNKLNLANFFNNEKKVSEWVQNVADAFNLDIIQNGNNVDINVKKKINTNVVSTVEIDDRANSADAESQAIEYPRSMAVKYKIDTDEWGFERSAAENAGGDESIFDDDDWVKYGDSGFTVIKLNDDSYVTTTSDKNLDFSYTWYQNFNWYAVNSAFTKTSSTAVNIRIPCISKYTYMIDGYDYVESMKHDGYGQPQRFWFKAAQASWATNQYVWTRTYPPEQVWLYTPSNVFTNYSDLYFNLSYKDTERSLLTEFFNINAYLASNYVELEVYLSADEYNRIKSGSLVHFDSDLYIPVEISGYDPAGINPTTLKIMKKVV